jgi:predicted small secreted protein
MRNGSIICKYDRFVWLNGSQEILMTLRVRLRGLSLALAIFAVLGAGMFASACGTVAGASQDKAGNIRAWLQY